MKHHKFKDVYKRYRIELQENGCGNVSIKILPDGQK